MNEEEKKAIEYYTNNEYTFGFETEMNIEDFKKALGIEETDEDTFEKHQIRFKTLLNLIEKQKAELDKKDRIIDNMAEVIEECRQNDCIESEEIDLSQIAGTEKIIEYFEKKVGEE